MALTVRGKALRWLTLHRGCTEQPAGSNRDNRQDGITAAQRRLGAWLVGLPWCGVWAANALLAAGVKGVNYRQASVAFIEDDARAGRAPFRDWQPPSAYRKALRGDLVVLFGRGAHVGTFRSWYRRNGQIFIVTDEGNTSPGGWGSQSNGGGSYRRVRPLSQVHGFARADFPGGWTRSRLARAASVFERARVEPEPYAPGTTASSDRALLKEIERLSSGDPEAFEFRDALRGALS